MIVAPKLTRLSLAIFDAVVDRYEAKFATDQVEADVRRELKKCDLNNDEYIDDIARSLVRGTLSQRAKSNPFITDKHGNLCPEKFSRRDFKRGIIRLGNSYHVKMSDATAPEWLVRIAHQQRAAQASGQAALLTTRWLGTEPGVLLMHDYKLKTDSAMGDLRLWDLEAPIEYEGAEDERADDDDQDA
jgi:hypothetical protein